MFRSYFLAGFECATGYNMHGEWIDQVAATEHDLHADADYDRLAQVGIHAVREAIRWPLVDRGDRYDFSSVEPFLNAALRHEFDVIWDLFHFGYPNGADPFSASFIERFAQYCHESARYIAKRMHHCYFTPINEPSYFAWAGGEAGLFAPHARGRGFELKVALARAALRGIDAIRDACPAARIINVDPICRVVPGSEDPAAIEHARRFNEEWVYEFWDIVGGRAMPELGGSPERLDIVGVNYYWTNQWQLGMGGKPLGDDDPRRVPLGDLVRAVWRRYGCEVLITETSALGTARAPWLQELSRMAQRLIGEGVPLSGICLYPILGMPEWHARDQWARMGLWDLEREQEMLQRKACQPMLDALSEVQQVGVDRHYQLARSGRAPLRFRGRLVWEQRRSGLLSVRLFRSYLPQRQWILAITLPIAVATIEHVAVRAELRVLLDHMRALDARQLAALHDCAYDGALEPLQRAWLTALAELQRTAAGIGALPAQHAYEPHHGIEGLAASEG